MTRVKDCLLIGELRAFYPALAAVADAGGATSSADEEREQAKVEAMAAAFGVSYEEALDVYERALSARTA